MLLSHINNRLLYNVIDWNGEVRLECDVMPNCRQFRYIGSVFHESDMIDKHVHISQNGMSKMEDCYSSVMRWKNTYLSERKVFIMLVRSTILYGIVCWVA